MLLEVKDLNTYYGESHVLQGISLTVEKGELVCLLGRNGMGKSTTLKSIMGLVKPKSGLINFKGEQILGMPAHKTARVGIGYVPETREIFPNLTVTDNLLLGIKKGKYSKGVGKDWTLERIYEHFPILKTRGSNKGFQLSGGEQQMLTIARTLMGNPELLLIDEPTEGLAPVMVEEVRDVLIEINKAGVSILLVEHNIKVALAMAHRLYLMGKAHVGFEGTPEELAKKPEIKRQYLEV
ncbi:MAG: ABC transporter ATP-binding protein [Syntrophales bacterium]|jgi:branched-chain amino acid transport system ATP-binding protein|nr:ABC transporter ATP-binding protein [Syntrophales bacterium]MDY0044206.1 ABC transporter ATP-binding protein [Syntrophales bacterium]